ncbi:MAG: hypothetical protein R6V06_07305 [Kiritimatiellia bacterium]
MIISSNTDEKADPQIFAQNEEADFSFYFIRADPESEPGAEILAGWKELAAHHQVKAYYIPVNTNSEIFDTIPLTAMI